MSREEEKYQAANNAWNLQGLTNQEQKIPYKLGFLEGFDYADQYPRKGLWDGDRVIAWLKENIDEYYMTGEFEEYFDSMYEDLKKEMED